MLSSILKAALSKVTKFLIWTERTASFTGGLRDVVWGSGGFVAVGENVDVITSSDGITWTTRTVSGGSSLKIKVKWSNNRYVITYGSGIEISTDNISWTSISAYVGPTTTPFYRSTIYTGSIYVSACSNPGAQDGAIYTSSTGAAGTWTARYTQVNYLEDVAWSPTTLVAVGWGGTIISSSDGGINWTARTSGTAVNLNGVAWTGTQFIAGGNSGTILTSPDGINWTARTSGIFTALEGIVQADDTIVVTGASGRVICSEDGGATWRSRSPRTGSVYISGVAWSGSTVVVVADNGLDQPVISTSQ